MVKLTVPQVKQCRNSAGLILPPLCRGKTLPCNNTAETHPQHMAANLRSKKAKTAEGDDVSNNENVSLDTLTREAEIDIEGDGPSPAGAVHYSS
jgi:hypothetical protein